MNLSPEERAVGQQNFENARNSWEVNRRDFIKGSAGAAAGVAVGGSALYAGWSKIGDPVRIGVIGTGDEGNVLIGAINPDYVQVKAIADIRPSSVFRAFNGDWSSPAALEARKGLMAVYGWKSEDEARRNVKVYEDYHELLKDPDIEGVIIALPLHLHAPAAIAAMKAGKHVLTEKLMAHNIAQCKVMSRFSIEQKLLLATGHQRHYSVLYDNAVNLIRWGLLGQLHHIRAQWHRGNLPGADSWAPALPGGFTLPGSNKKHDPIAKKIGDLRNALKDPKNLPIMETLEKQLAQQEALDRDKEIRPEEHGYEEITLSDGRVRTAMEELIRWRLWERTGGGLMAELGSHQLDASTIFCSALRADGKKSHPISVHAVGGRHIFPLDRDADDHVYCMFEYPGPAYDFEEDANAKPEEIIKKQIGYYDVVNSYPTLDKGIAAYETDPHKKIVVTYSSINGNGFGGYGECVMGTKGTLILDREQEVMLYRNAETTTSVTVRQSSGGPTLDTVESGAPTAAAAGGAKGKVSRGYREEIEHWAWCIRNRAPENNVRCHPEVALGDAVIALTAKVAIANGNKGKSGYIEYKKEWFDIDSDETPDGSVIADEKKNLKA